MIVKKADAERGAKTKHGRSTAPSRRPHGIKLADVFLWITVVDECQHHPRGAFQRAADSEGFKSEGNVQHRLLVLETLFGQLFQRPPPKKPKERSEEEKSHPTHDRSKHYRSGVPTERGAALAELFAAIEHLYHYALSVRGGRIQLNNVIKAKNAVFRALPNPIRREFDREVFENKQRRNRITRTHAWNHRLRKRRRTNEPKRLSDLQRMRLRYPNDSK